MWEIRSEHLACKLVLTLVRWAPHSALMSEQMVEQLVHKLVLLMDYMLVLRKVQLSLVRRRVRNLVHKLVFLTDHMLESLKA